MHDADTIIKALVEQEPPDPADIDWGGEPEPDGLIQVTQVGVTVAYVSFPDLQTTELAVTGLSPLRVYYIVQDTIGDNRLFHIRVVQEGVAFHDTTFSGVVEQLTDYLRSSEEVARLGEPRIVHRFTYPEEGINQLVEQDPADIDWGAPPEIAPGLSRTAFEDLIKDAINQEVDIGDFTYGWSRDGMMFRIEIPPEAPEVFVRQLRYRLNLLPGVASYYTAPAIGLPGAPYRIYAYPRRT